MWPTKAELATYTEVYRTDTSIVYKKPDGTLICTDHAGRPPIPIQDRERFWAMGTEDKVDWMFAKLAKLECSAAWMAELLAYLGLMSEDKICEAANILRGAYPQDGDTPIEQIKEELRAIGVSV